MSRDSPDGTRVFSKALPYHKCRDHIVWLGRLADLEHLLEFYQVRRCLAEILTVSLSQAVLSPCNVSVSSNPLLRVTGTLLSVLTAEERNQTMGHNCSTYEQFYMPDLIEREFQSIYFGTPSQDLLIRSVARMGRSRDDWAPTDLTVKQNLEVSKSSEPVRLLEKRK